MEGDKKGKSTMARPQKISIHALRVEGDSS